jgi:hypothetical protein
VDSNHQPSGCKPVALPIELVVDLEPWDWTRTVYLPLTKRMLILLSFQGIWTVLRDLNPPVQLGRLMPGHSAKHGWSYRLDSNQRPAAYDAAALPTELRQQIKSSRLDSNQRVPSTVSTAYKTEPIRESAMIRGGEKLCKHDAFDSITQSRFMSTDEWNRTTNLRLMRPALWPIELRQHEKNR